ncbi:MAG: 3'-5' exonuclease [Gammaproteobacteria bacterium]|nr:3'-5' exonuclease [Gammaproteobacteria bacterium]MBU1978430.1 3'-5' exonuclease [Gammaproteobacteria bacterium]
MSLLKQMFGAKPQLTASQVDRLRAWRDQPEPDTRLPFDASRLVVVDVETSGLDVRKDHLIAIGAVTVVNGKIILADSLDIVLQQRYVSGKDNILIHGIGGEAQRQGMHPADALLAFLEFLGKSPLIAFHVEFDQSMIGRAMKAHLGFRFEHTWADLAYVAPALYPQLARRYRSLDKWMELFGIGNYARHSALADALATAELLLALRPQLEARQTMSFQSLRDLERERRLQTHPI